MKIPSIIAFIFLSLFCVTGTMASAPQTMQVGSIKSLNEVHLSSSEKESYSDLINTLMQMTANPYSNSLPLLASAYLGEKSLYFTTLTSMLRSLSNMDNNPLPAGVHQDEWMKNNAFKAWMWGRVLLAADSMNDAAHVKEAKQKIEFYLGQEMTEKENPAFFAWARAYLAALNAEEYKRQIIQVRIDINNLAATYEKSHTQQDLSNVLWECIMAINAAASVGDDETYQGVIDRMLEVTKEKTIKDAIAKHLIRSKKSQDYPAWALSMIELASARMNDDVLYSSLNKAMPGALAQAKAAQQTGEYTLAKLEHALARFNRGRAKPKMSP